MWYAPGKLRLTEVLNGASEQAPERFLNAGSWVACLGLTSYPTTHCREPRSAERLEPKRRSRADFKQFGRASSDRNAVDFLQCGSCMLFVSEKIWPVFYNTIYPHLRDRV